jgi:hypothetical protein
MSLLQYATHLPAGRQVAETAKKSVAKWHWISYSLSLGTYVASDAARMQ